MKHLLILCCCFLLFAQGCVPALLIAAGGYLMSVEKKSAAEFKKTYNSYLKFMEEINLERNKAGLEPKPILTYQEWMKGMK